MLSTEEISELMIRALEGKYSKFEYIKTWSQAAFTIEYYQAMKKVVKAIKKASKLLYKQYLKDVKEGNNDSIEIVGGIHQVEICLDFYTKETQLAYDMLDEFYCYCLRGGNLLNILAGEERPSQDLEDYRKGRWSL